MQSKALGPESPAELSRNIDWTLLNLLELQ